MRVWAEESYLLFGVGEERGWDKGLICCATLGKAQ